MKRATHSRSSAWCDALRPRRSARSVLSPDGYPLNYGTSFLFVIAFDEGRPRGRAVLTYGQSGDLVDEQSRDQMELFSAKEWRETWFDAADVAANAEGETIVVGE